MTRHVLGRDAPDTGASDRPIDDTLVASLGAYRAADGSEGAPVGLDLDRPHAALVVGKRGAGKSYTLGVLAEEAAAAPGVAPVVVDPMGVFDGLGALGGEVVRDPAVPADAVPPAAWPPLLGLEPTEPAGALVWQAAAAAETLAGMHDHVAAETDRDVRRAAANHLRLASSWGVFDPDGLTSDALATATPTVLDLSGQSPSSMNAVVRGVARALYDARLNGATPRFPWLLLDEAHAFFDGVAGRMLRTLLTRGRTPGVSLVAATQRPSALPPVATSQADLVVAHRLTSTPDIEALTRARPTYLEGVIAERLPAERGVALVVDDATEATHVVRIRERETSHGGATPRVSQRDRDPVPAR